MTGSVWMEDTWITSSQIAPLRSKAITFHISAVFWCLRHDSDGFLPGQELQHLFPITDTDQVIVELIEAGLWHRDGDEGFLVSTDGFMYTDGGEDR